jgi:hypothetical protein
MVFGLMIAGAVPEAAGPVLGLLFAGRVAVGAGRGAGFVEPGFGAGAGSRVGAAGFGAGRELLGELPLGAVTGRPAAGTGVGDPRISSGGR